MYGLVKSDKMKRFIIKNKQQISLCISILESVILGIYLSFVSESIMSGQGFLSALFAVHNSWIWFVVSLICFACQFGIERLSSKEITTQKTNLINSILEQACKAFVYPHINYHIRAMITVCDLKKGTRKTVYGYNIGISPERFAEYKIDFGVTGKAYKLKRPVAEALPPNHISTYDETHKNYVEERLKCVLAAPIFSAKISDKVIGVLAFDSIESIEKMKFESNESKMLAQGWADIISHIIDE